MRVDSSGWSPSAGLWIRCPAWAVALLAYSTFYRNHILSFSPSVLSAVRLLLLHEHEPHQPSSSYTKLGLVYSVYITHTCRKKEDLLSSPCYILHFLGRVWRYREAKSFVQGPRKAKLQVLDLNPSIPAPRSKLLIICCTVLV